MSKKAKRIGRMHIVIPDMQVCPDKPTDHCEWVGKYIAEKRPDVIINIGDFADMPSLSTYDMGRKAGEGARYVRDIEAAQEGMERLVAPFRKVPRYRPEMHLTLGNHEHRIDRHVESYPHLEGTLSTNDLAYEDWGWTVHPFLKPVVVDGVAYCHFFPNPFNGKPIGGSAGNVLKSVMHSYVQGHKQSLEVATLPNIVTGAQLWGITAGACYPYDFDYKGHTGNHHWRGIVVLNEVEDGNLDPMFVSLKYLEEKYG